MSGFRSRQAILLVALCVSLLVSLAASALLRGLVIQIVWGPPWYINPVILLTFLLYGGLGFAITSGTGDGGWPWFLGGIGLWIFLVAYEDSILQWFLFQLGVATIGGRINPIQMAALTAAVGAAVLLHVNQLGRRVREGLADRGLDPRELADIETRSFQAGFGVVTRLVLLVAAAAFILLIGEFILGPTSVGLGVLGILGAIVIVGVIAAYAFSLLRQGPLPDVRIQGGGQGRKEADGHRAAPTGRAASPVQDVRWAQGTGPKSQEKRRP